MEGEGRREREGGRGKEGEERRERKGGKCSDKRPALAPHTARTERQSMCTRTCKRALT